MKLFRNFFTAIAASLILAGTAYANVNPTFTPKTPYTIYQIAEAATCPEGRMSIEDLAKQASNSGLFIERSVRLEGDLFDKFIRHVPTPPEGTVAFNVLQLNDGTVFLSAVDRENCSFGGLRINLDVFKSILDAASGQPVNG